MVPSFYITTGLYPVIVLWTNSVILWKEADERSSSDVAKRAHH